MKIAKKSVVILLIILGLVLGISYAVGNYFVEYALVYQSGGENRPETLTPQKAKEDNLRTAALAKSEAFIQEDVTKPIETVSIKSQDQLTLKGHVYRQKETAHKWVILVHGYQVDEESTQALIPEFYQKGYNVLTVAMRGHGVSEGDYIGMGFLEKDDILSWTQYLVEQDPKAEIVYHGTSMGASTVLFASGLKLPSNVKAIIADCGYDSVFRIFKSELKVRFNLAPFPVLYLAEAVAQMKIGLDFEKADVTQYVKKSKVPIMIIHTEEDDFVPVRMAKTIYKAIPGQKLLLILPKGTHAQARYVAPEKYYNGIFGFLKDVRGLNE